MAVDQHRIDALVRSPSESLNVEVKNWIGTTLPEHQGLRWQGYGDSAFNSELSPLEELHPPLRATISKREETIICHGTSSWPSSRLA